MGKKVVCKVRNWKEYSPALVNRGDLAIWVKGGNPLPVNIDYEVAVNLMARLNCGKWRIKRKNLVLCAKVVVNNPIL